MSGPSWRLTAGALLAASVLTTGCNRQVVRPVGPPASGPANPGAILAPDATAEAGPLKPSPAQEVLIHLDMARALDTQGQHDKALAEYQRAVQKYKPAVARGSAAPERARLHRRMGGALDRLARFDEAAGHYAEAKRLTPDDPRVWNDAGYSAYLQGRWPDAERDLLRAIQLDPTDTRAQTNLGLTLAARGETDRAYEVLARAGGPATARANIAYVLAAQGRADDARAYYQQALATDTQLAVARRGLATLDRPTRPASDVVLTTHQEAAAK